MVLIFAILVQGTVSSFAILLFCYFKRDWYNFAFSLDSISKKGSDAQASLGMCFQKKKCTSSVILFQKNWYKQRDHFCVSGHFTTAK